MPDRRARVPGQRAEADREREGVGAVSLVEPVGIEERRREFRLELASGIVHAFDAHPNGPSGVRPCAKVFDLVLLDRDGERPDRLAVHEHRRRRIGNDLEVPLQGPARERREHRVLRRVEVPEVAARGAGRELVLLEQGDRRPPPRELEGARRADDPATHDYDVGHRREPIPSVESTSETWLSGRKQPPAKRLGG
jgi:hypothetical protein